MSIIVIASGYPENPPGGGLGGSLGGGSTTLDMFGPVITHCGAGNFGHMERAAREKRGAGPEGRYVPDREEREKRERPVPSCFFRNLRAGYLL